LTNNGGCDSNADCKNTPGGFNCACQKGYSGDGFNCTGNCYLPNSQILLALYHINLIKC